MNDSEIERWASVHHTRQDRWDSVPPGASVLINTLSHYMWDEVNRYCLTFIDAAGQRRTAEANDLALNVGWLCAHIAGPLPLVGLSESELLDIAEGIPIDPCRADRLLNLTI